MVTIKSVHTLTGTINNVACVSGEVSVGNVITIGNQNFEYYDGVYDIKPTTEDQTLNTKDKTMREDLEIKAIPYAEVTNEANGITVTIGG